jgi:hypothetical protein
MEELTKINLKQHIIRNTQIIGTLKYILFIKIL